MVRALFHTRMWDKKREKEEKCNRIMITEYVKNCCEQSLLFIYLLLLFIITRVIYFYDNCPSR